MDGINSKQLSVFSDDRNPTSESSSASVTSAPVTQVMDVHHQHSSDEDFVLVWLDSHIDESNDNYLTDLTLLQTFVNSVSIFTDSDECIDFITDITSQRVFMIVSDTVSEQTISAIHDIPQVNTIFIFSATGGKQEEPVKMYTKVKGVYTQMTSISAALKLSINQYDQDSISISFVSNGSSTSTSDLDQPEPSFVCAQILNEILLHMEYDERSKENFIQYLRSQYTDNEYRLKMIDEFANEDRSESSISWYTRDAFFYHVLNRALRTLEFSAIIPMSFFIRDLYTHVQIHAGSSQRQVYFFLPDFETRQIHRPIRGFNDTRIYLYCTNEDSVTLNRNTFRERALYNIFTADRIEFHLNAAQLELLYELKLKAPRGSAEHDEWASLGKRRLNRLKDLFREHVEAQLGEESEN